MTPGHFYGPTTLSKDSTNLYLFLHGRQNGPIMLKGLKNKIKELTVLGKGTHLKSKVVGKISWSPIPGLVYIDVPKSVADKYVMVVKVHLEGSVKLYKGQGGLK